MIPCSPITPAAVPHGFDEGCLIGPVYHGSDAEFDTFDPDLIGTATGSADYGNGFYFALDPEAARWGRNVRAFYLRLRNPLRTDLTPDEFWDRYSGEERCSERIRSVLIAAGFDGVIAPEEVVAFYPEQIIAAEGYWPRASAVP